MSSYNFVISYRKGSENRKADAFSRRSNYFRDKEEVKYLILRARPSGDLEYNYAVLVATFIAENNDFTKRLRDATTSLNKYQDLIQNAVGTIPN